ncbi:uncharacterized protein J3R85_002014 [Psidium guajava]|nr:uncharacterized protein J3R85_002014 [Psidium guajava]
MALKDLTTRSFNSVLQSSELQLKCHIARPYSGKREEGTCNKCRT